MVQRKMILVNPDDPPAPMQDADRAAVSALAQRQRGANGLLMKAINAVGGGVEDGLRVLPKGLRDPVEGAARAALWQAYRLAEASRLRGPVTWVGGDRANRVMATVSGALGGMGGLPTALLELPVATAIIFRSVQDVAAQYGEDPSAAETRAECLRVFGAGGTENGLDTGFVGARLTLTGPAIHALIAQVAPRFGLVVGQKLLAGAVPLLGAAAGAGTNWAFVRYYTDMAHVHFGLRAAARADGEDAVLGHFHSALAALRNPVSRA